MRVLARGESERVLVTIASRVIKLIEFVQQCIHSIRNGVKFHPLGLSTESVIITDLDSIIVSLRYPGFGLRVRVA